MKNPLKILGTGFMFVGIVFLFASVCAGGLAALMGLPEILIMCGTLSLAVMGLGAIIYGLGDVLGKMATWLTMPVAERRVDFIPSPVVDFDSGLGTRSTLNGVYPQSEVRCSWQQASRTPHRVTQGVVGSSANQLRFFPSPDLAPSDQPPSYDESQAMHRNQFEPSAPPFEFNH